MIFGYAVNPGKLLLRGLVLKLEALADGPSVPSLGPCTELRPAARLMPRLRWEWLPS